MTTSYIINPELPPEKRAATSIVSTVNASVISVVLLDQNAQRLGATIYNESTANLYINLGNTATTSSYTVLLIPNAYYEVPYNYNGVINGVWGLAVGSAHVTELI